MEEITQREYWQQVKSIAEDVTEEARDEGRDICDALHEAIDGHEWIIYTYYNIQVMHHTENTDALIDSQGADALQGKESWGEIIALFAYCALESDVMNHEAFDAEPDEDDAPEPDTSTIDTEPQTRQGAVMSAPKLTQFDFQRAFRDRRAGYLSEVEVDNMLMDWLKCPSWEALVLEIQEVREQLSRPGEDEEGY